MPANQVNDVTAAGTAAGISKGDTLDSHAKDSNKECTSSLRAIVRGGLFRESSNVSLPRTVIGLSVTAYTAGF